VRAVNLIPSEQRGGAANVAGRSDGGAFFVLALMGAFAIFALLYGVARHQISSRETQAAKLTVQAQNAKAQASRLAPYTSFVALHDQRQQAVSQLVSARFDWAHAFHELGRVLPEDASLTSVHGTIGAEGAPATAAPPSTAASSSVASATPPGSTPTFTISGCATSQSEVAQTLVRLRLIDGVSDVKLQSSTKAGSGSSSGSAASGGCTGNEPAFTVQISFAALPAAPATTSGSTASAGASTTQPATSTAAAPASTSTGGS
jgi:Tfp pilus assembly protein PilN